MDTPFVTQRGPKVRVVASPSTWIEGEALRQLDTAAALPGMDAVVGMPDLHPGKGGPVGAAFLSQGFIHPALVGSDIGCGMSLWATDLPLRKARPERLAERMNGLDLPWDGNPADWLAARACPPTSFDATLGTPGRGNHFIEVQEVVDVRHDAAFAALGLDRTRACVLVHSGSRGLGEAVLRDHTARMGAAALPEDDGTAYLQAHDAAVRWAAANRALCGARACEAIGTEGRPVLDLCHNSVTQTAADGCRCWLHRKGAAPADQGPVVIPGSRGDLSWLVLPVPGAEGALASLAHGAGRKIARGDARGKLRGLYRRDDLRRNPWGGRVVCGEDALAWEEAPEAYKPVATVVNDLVGAGLVELVAALRPLVTFKTSEGARDETRRTRDDRRRNRTEARDAKRGGGA